MNIRILKEKKSADVQINLPGSLSTTRHRRRRTMRSDWLLKQMSSRWFGQRQRKMLLNWSVA